MSEDRLTPTPGMVGRDERSDDERRAGVTLEDLHELVQAGFKNVLGAQAETNDRLSDVEDRIGDLEAVVFSEPPPPPRARAGGRLAAARIVRRRGAGERAEQTADKANNDVRPPMRSLTEVARDNTNEIAGLEGRILVLESINKQQSRAMGLAMPDAAWWRKAAALVMSRKGVELAISVVILVATIAGSQRAIDAAQHVQDAVQRTAPIPGVIP